MASDEWPKSFLYLSPTKIESLFGQLDGRSARRIAKKLTLNLKIISAEFAADDAQSESVYSRLRVVLEHLERQSKIGTVDEPGPYIRGTLPMRWGPYGMGPSPAVIFFGGHSEATVLGMGGSIENTFGGVGGPPVHSHSATASLLRALARDDHSVEVPEAAALENDWELRATRLAVSGAKGPLQMVEFVAKRLLWGELDDGYAYGLRPPRTMLASPLYVAQAD